MKFNYYVKFSPPDAGVNTIINDFVRLSYSNRLNDIGYATITLPRNHALANSLAIDSFVLVMRGQPHDTVGASYYQDFAGIYRGSIETTESDGKELITLHFPDALSLVAREIVAFQAGIANRSEWAGKTIAQIWSDILTYNFAVTDANRLLPFTSHPVDPRVFKSDPSASAVINYSAAYKNVLTTLQELAALGSFYFRGKVAKVFGGGLSEYQAVFVEPDPGTDRTSSMVFDLGRANISSVELDKRRVNEPTKIIVGGQGEGTTRTVRVRTGGEYTNINHTEAFVDARDLVTTAALDTRGDTKLAETAYKPRFIFRAAQAPGSYYGRDYFLGDRVACRYRGAMFTRRIVGATVAVDEKGQESIELDLDDA